MAWSLARIVQYIPSDDFSTLRTTTGSPFSVLRISFSTNIDPASILYHDHLYNKPLLDFLAASLSIRPRPFVDLLTIYFTRPAGPPFPQSHSSRLVFPRKTPNQ